MSNLADDLNDALIEAGFEPSELVRRSILDDIDQMYRQQVGRDPTVPEIVRAVGVFKATGHFGVEDIPR